jgi:hypothetical protein
MTEAELAAIQARTDAATPPEWSHVRDELGHWRIVWTHSRNSSVGRRGKFFSDEDAAFIAHARTDIPALLAEVRRLREALKEITRLGTGHSLDSALVVARAALAPPAAESNR